MVMMTTCKFSILWTWNHNLFFSATSRKCALLYCDNQYIIPGIQHLLHHDQTRWSQMQNLTQDLVDNTWFREQAEHWRWWWGRWRQRGAVRPRVGLSEAKQGHRKKWVLCWAGRDMMIRRINNRRKTRLKWGKEMQPKSLTQKKAMLSGLRTTTY